MENEINRKVDIKHLLSLITDNENHDDIQKFLFEEYEKSLKFNKNLSYENLYYRLCPNLSFKNVKMLSIKYLKRIEKELKNIELINVNI